MFGQTPPEVGCIDGSIESLCSGAVAGGVYGFVFREPPPVGMHAPMRILQHLKFIGKVAFIAGSWCFYGSTASCCLVRGGLNETLAAAGAGT